MKKVISLILLASIVLSAASCSENREKAASDTEVPANSVTDTAVSTTETEATESKPLVTTGSETTKVTSSEKTEETTIAVSTETETEKPVTTASSSAKTEAVSTTVPAAATPDYADGDYEYIAEDVEECESDYSYSDGFYTDEVPAGGVGVESNPGAGVSDDCCEMPWEPPFEPPYEPPYIDEIQARAGILTGGEWNDNDNWSFWQNLVGQNSDWKSISENRGLYPDDRYKVTVVSGGKPCVGYKVSLFTDRNEVWTAVTDNHGEAYLFNTLEKNKDKVEYIYIYGKDEEDAEISDPTHDEYFDFKYEKPSKIEKLDLMLMIDTTGSMSDELTYLQKELQDVVERVEKEYANSDIRLSVNFYRDEGDDYIVREFPFTDDIDDAITDLRQQYASGGGDTPEAVTDALNSAINKHKWRNDSTKLMFLVLDAPNHNEDNDKLHGLISSAAEKGIRIIPVASSGVDTETEFICRTMAIATGGTYTFLTDDSGVGGSHLEPTIGDYDVEMLNDMLVRIIGDYMDNLDKVTVPDNTKKPEKPVNGKPEEIALDYIQNELGIKGRILDTEFYHYDYGITGGLYQYLFTFESSNGDKYVFYFHSYDDITETKLNDKNFTIQECVPSDCFCIKTSEYYSDHGMYSQTAIYCKEDADRFFKKYGEITKIKEYCDKVDFTKYAVVVQAVSSHTGSAKCTLKGFKPGKGSDIIDFDYAIDYPEIGTDDMATFFLVALVPLIAIE